MEENGISTNNAIDCGNHALQQSYVTAEDGDDDSAGDSEDDSAGYGQEDTAEDVEEYSSSEDSSSDDLISNSDSFEEVKISHDYHENLASYTSFARYSVGSVDSILCYVVTFARNLVIGDPKNN